MDFNKLFRFQSRISFTNLILSASKEADLNLPDTPNKKALTELFIKWYSKNNLCDLVVIIDSYLPINQKFFIDYKNIIFMPETIPTILSISKNPNIILVFLKTSNSSGVTNV